MPAETSRNSWILICEEENLMLAMKFTEIPWEKKLNNVGPTLNEKMNQASASFGKSWWLISSDFNHTKFYVLVENCISML